ncbi:MAG: UDP-N-acetylglucosamine 1-carboxyvinyltransferase, partial [Pseudanabaenaceae cyanobacterium]
MVAEKQEAVLHIVGKARLQGHVPISGAKNSALALMAGALLSSEGCTIENLPCLMDVQRMEEILVSLGVKVQREAGRIHLDTTCLSSAQAPYELVSQMRASFFIIGPLLSRLGIAQIPLPGGCAIGARPVDLHVKGLQAMGAEVEISHGIVHASCPGGRLQGAKVYLDYPSVGATETIMMAATLAEGETVIQNAAQEPEVVDLANFCRTLGAKIYGAGSKTIVIVGVPQLHGGTYRVIPDRIEAGTYMIAGAITCSDITLGPVIPEHLGALIAKLREIG